MPCYDLFATSIALCALVTSATPPSPSELRMPAGQKKGFSANGTSQTTPLRGTFTAEEVATLKTWLPIYLQTKRVPGKKLIGFWEPMLADWWTCYPLPPLTAEEFAVGIDQGDRQGERAGITQRVSEIESYLANIVTHHYARKYKIGLVITAVMLHLAQENAPFWIW